MRKLLTICVVLCSALGWAGTCGNGYSFSRQILLMKAVGSDQTNYPVLISSTYATSKFKGQMKTVANGGQIQNTANNSIGVSGPADLVFCDASSAGNALKYEVAYYDGTNGLFEIWVKIPTLHTASQDSIWLFANNSGVSTSQQDLTMWSDASFLQVCHFPNGSTLNVNCSLGGTQTNQSATATTGKIDGGAVVISASSQYIDTGSAQNGASITYEAWVKPNTFVNCSPIMDNISGGNGVAFLYGVNAGGGCATNGRLSLVVASGGSSFECSNSTNVTMELGTWTYVAVTKTGSGMANVNLYSDGVAQGKTAGCVGSLAVINGGGNSRIGSENGAGNADATFDEVRYSNTVRSQDWISTTLKYESSFYSTFQVVESSYSTPSMVQFASCVGNYTTPVAASCTLPFPVTSGGLLVYVQAPTSPAAGDCFNSIPTDGLGLTLTGRVQGDFTGTLQHYYDCQFTAPITATGVDTVTAGDPNAGLIVMELKTTTTSGVTTANSINNSPVGAMTASCSGSSCFLICSENLTNSQPGPYETFGNSEGYTEIVGPYTPPLIPDHSASVYAAYGNVASGSRTCTITGSGQAGTLMILGPAATTSKRRPSQVY